jgi:acetolactate synthase-1/2/3 large subunit
MWTAQTVRLTQPGQRYLRCAGSLGWGFPATLGAKAALPNQTVVGFAGDAGFYYHIGELETAARNGLNAIMIVNNNYSGGVGEASPFVNTISLAEAANSLGCFGIRVEKPDQIRPALDKAAASGKPAVVEVVADPTARAKRAWTPDADH